MLIDQGVSFGLTSAPRATTHALRRMGAGGNGGTIVNGRHLHHDDVGRAMLTAVGAVAVDEDVP